MARSGRKGALPVVLAALIAAVGGWLYGRHAPAPQNAKGNAGLVVASVTDGDTVVLADGRRVRYIGVNAPEISHGGKPGEPWGPEAKAWNARMVSGKGVSLKNDAEEKDRYGRTLAYLYLSDGAFVNGKMVADGYAYCLPVPPNTGRMEELLALQRAAMDAKRGMWGKFREPPGEGSYVGNPRSLRFHLPSHYPMKEGRVRFSSMREAFYAGYAPCKECLGSWASQCGL